MLLHFTEFVRKISVETIESDVSEIKSRLGNIEELLKCLKWSSGVLIMIALALVTNFIYSLVLP